MGKGVSKSHVSPLLQLCKERKEFIKAAKYCRYDLVSAFMVYLESLLELGNALNTYVEQELIFCADISTHNVSLSDFDEEEDTHLELSSSESDLHSLFHGSHCDHKEEEEEESISPFHESSNKEGCNNINMSSKNEHYSNHENVHDHVTMSHGEGLEHHGNGLRMSFDNRFEETPKSGHWFLEQHDQDYFGAPAMSFSYHNDKLVHYGNEAFSKFVTPYNHVELQKHGTGDTKPATTMPTPPPPSPPQVTTWDFLYPFSQNDDVYYDNDLDLRQVREKEGIPDLEDENEIAKSSTVFDEKVKDSGMRHGMNCNVQLDSDKNVREVREKEGIADIEHESETAKSSAVFDEKTKESGMNYAVHLDSDKNVREVKERGVPDLEDECDLSSTVSSVFDEKEMESEMRHGLSGNDTSNVTQLNPNEDALSGKIKVLTIWRKSNEKDMCSKAEVTNVHGRMSLKEAVLDISNEFKYAFDSGKEFYSVIEVANLPYQSICTRLRAFASHVLGLITPSRRTYLLPSYMSYQPVSRPKKLSKPDKLYNQEHVCSGDLSSTLEMLYLWEKKLYREIIVEEKLQVPYDKKYKSLKKLDDKGSETDKIDENFASMKLLLSEINVSVQSIIAISRQIHELTDNKLLLELNKLIEGLFRLWKVMSTCHQKQLQTITKAKSHVHILDPKNRKKSSSKTTLRLERVFLKWGMCFNNFINIQKAFLKNLHGWLLRHTEQELEETIDGNGPVLQSDTKAPHTFRICNEWYHAIDKISETEVSEAISNFASNLHQLYEKLEEEKALKVRVKSLLKYYQHKLKLLCNQNGTNSDQCISFINMKASENFDEDEVPLLRESGENIGILRKTLIEQKKRHKQVIRHVNDIASSCLQKGLPPIFEAMGNFCLENMKIYEQLTFQNTAPS
ncbi:hypothetical protein TanjilG_25971 [Lupinus angustifolius]|uniref:DUF632 domain-containing protein n=2 Tax=Lupinus angustifolius TaxID=3871 RepID=A0A4P1QZ44_LUPAN|nr:hypothetical protein TanjilG_25971 [Lupinus angustifolius]